MTIQAPQLGEYHPYYFEYIGRVQGDVLEFMKRQHADTHGLLRGLSEEQASARPAAEEWSIKQIIGHLSDTERIFSYRALRFGRGDETEIPGYYQNPYVENGHFEERTLADLLDEYDAIRNATLFLVRNFTDAATERIGVASGNPMSVRALLYVIAGHEHHHTESIRTVYLGKKE